MVRRYFNILVAIVLAPSFALFFILPGIAKCRRSSIASITVWIILAAFVLTKATLTLESLKMKQFEQIRPANLAALGG